MLDKRRKKELCEEMGVLADSYTPEWKFTFENADIGSVAMGIFAEQMEEVIKEYNTLPDKYENELVRMLGVIPRKPEPAHAILVLEPSLGMTEGAWVSDGSRFYAQQEEQDTPVIFEAVHDLFITEARITAAFAVSEKKKTVIPLVNEEESLTFPLSLFCCEPSIPYLNELFICHPYLFRGDLSQFSIDIGNEKTAELLVDRGRFGFYFLTEEGRIPISEISQEGKQIRICQGADSDTIIIERKAQGDEELFFPQLYLTAGSQEAVPEFLYDGDKEITGNKLRLFGEEITLYKECFIGFTSGLIQQDTHVSLEFSLAYEENEVRNAPLKEEELKLIKRKPNPKDEELLADVYIQEISFSYFNGKGYRRLPVEEKLKGMFSAAGRQGRGHIEFVCPPDWEQISQEGYEGYMIRIQIVKADQCYYRPAIHHCPVIYDLKAVYFHKEKELEPDRIVRKQGGRDTDLTGYIKRNKRIPAFPKFPHRGESMLLGFDRKPEGGPVSLYFIVRKNINFRGIQITFEYSSGKGFLPLKVVNNTEDIKSSGTILFVPPSNMSQIEIEGESRYWLRLKARNELKEDTVLPVIEHIYMNGMEVQNIVRSGGQEYYLEQAASYMEFPAPAKELLDVKVCVWEGNRLVPWKETVSFDMSGQDARHFVVDRLNKKVVFGDGRTVRIPKNLNGPAFTMEIISCDGSDGNVPANAIDSAAFPLQNVERIFNPLEASGGNGLESADSVNRRGRALLGTGSRLVSAQDYANAARTYSGMIANAWSQMGDTKITVAVLMQDYVTGSHSFQQIKDSLASYLINAAPSSVKEKNLIIREPVFVKVSVELWIEVKQWKRALEERSRILEELTHLFEPVKRRGHTEPRIGYFPKESQILMAVRSVSDIIRIERYSITASYTDESGRHTTELGRLRRGPFMVCVNGMHEVHVC